MKILKFNVSGKSAHFQKPDVNVYAYYTYSHIHKMVIYGILGAVIGLEGRLQQYNKGTPYPEYYEKLYPLKIGIVPINNNRGYFSKKIIAYNNSVGYGNKGADKKPCNLIVREQWLEKVSWDIYLCLDDLSDNQIKEKLIHYLTNGKAEYIPYLGKNNHFANISNAEIINRETTDQIEKIDSLFHYKKITLYDEAVEEDDIPFLFKDYMPTSLNPHNNKYELEILAYSNREVENIQEGQVVIVDEDRHIAFI